MLVVSTDPGVRQPTEDEQVAWLATRQEPSDKGENCLRRELDVEGLRRVRPAVENVQERLVARFEREDGRGGLKEVGALKQACLRVRKSDGDQSADPTWSSS